MAKSNDGGAWEWVSLWAAWRTQPLYIQQGWMTGKDTHGCIGLKPILQDFMDNFPKEVQDDVFKFAPADVQKYFGYKVVEEEAKAVKVEYKLTPKRREQLARLLEA